MILFPHYNDYSKFYKINKRFLNNFTASFQFTVGEIFKKKIFNALEDLKKDNIKIKDFSICGGVAANKYLNNLIQNFIQNRDINYHQVPLSLCTDNAAMIGWNAIEILQTRKILLNNYNIRPTQNILIHENF